MGKPNDNQKKILGISLLRNFAQINLKTKAYEENFERIFGKPKNKNRKPSNKDDIQKVSV